MDFNWKPRIVKPNESIEYKLILTAKGLRIKKITIKISQNSNKLNNVLLKIYKKKTQEKPQVNIKAAADTNVILRKKKIKKIDCEQEFNISSEMEKLQISKRKKRELDTEDNKPENCKKPKFN